MEVKRLRSVLAAIAAFISAAPPAAAQSLLRDAEIEEFIDDYARPLFRAADLPADEIDILLIGDPSFNAFAGGLTMGINTGLITLSTTPNQIQGVIAHEAGHIAGGHTARSDEALAAASRPMLLSLVLAAGAIAAGAPEAGIGLLGLGQNIGLADLLKYSRGQEAAADQAALTYLEAVGSSGAGLIETFEMLRNDQLLLDRRVDPYMQSHPLAAARVTALSDRAQSLSHYAVKDPPEEIARLKMIQAKINGFLQPPHVTLRQYPLSDQSDAARYARAVAWYRAADLNKGLAEIDRLLSAHPDNPYFNELRGQMLFEFGKVAESIAPHRRSVELAPDKALLKINLARALSATEDIANIEQAVTTIKSALVIEPDNSFGWFELARAYGALGKERMADLAMAESHYHNGAKPQAAQFARRALPGLERGSPEWRQAQDILAASLGEDAEEAIEAPSAPVPGEGEGRTRTPGEVPDPKAE